MADASLNDRPGEDPERIADETRNLMDIVRANKRELEERISDTSELVKGSQQLLRSVVGKSEDT